MRRLPFYADCVDWPRNQLAALMHLVDAGVLIDRAEFFRKINRTQIRPDWEPCPAGTPYGEAFYTLPGYRIYWYVHSAIEFVFAEASEVAALQTELGQ